MEWYGTDKPDLRNPIKMMDVSDFFVSSGFKIFADIFDKRWNTDKSTWQKVVAAGNFRIE